MLQDMKKKKGRVLLNCERSGTYSRRDEKIIAEEKSDQQQLRTTDTKKYCPFLAERQAVVQRRWVCTFSCMRFS